MNFLLVEGSQIRVFLNNNYTYAGTILAKDDEAIKLFDNKSQSKLIILLKDIKTIMELDKNEL